MTDTVIMTSDQGACSVVLDGVSYAAADGKFTIPTTQVADAKGHGLWPEGEARPAVVEPPKRHLLPTSLIELGHRLMGLQKQVDTLLELLSAHLSAGKK